MIVFQANSIQDILVNGNVIIILSVLASLLMIWLK